MRTIALLSLLFFAGSAWAEVVIVVYTDDPFEKQVPYYSEAGSVFRGRTLFKFQAMG